MSFDINEYFADYGADLEMAERAQLREGARQVREWLQKWGALLLDCYDAAGEAAVRLAPDTPGIDGLARRTAVYEMLSGAIRGGQWDRRLTFGAGNVIGRRSYTPFRQLFGILLELRGGPCTQAEAEEAVRRGRPLFEEEGRLEGGDMGLFWRGILRALPPGGADGPCPAALKDLTWQLGQCRELFQGEESGRAQALRDAVEEAWRRRDAQLPQSPCPPQAPPPDRACAESAVRRWSFSGRPWAVRELLAAAFPQVGAAFPGDKLLAVTEGEILAQTYQTDPALAIRMWRLVLDTAQARLSDPQAAKELIWDLMDIIWVDSYVDPLLPVPILDALEADEGFARQIFQSAYAGDAQEILLDACAAAGRQDQARRLEALLETSPYRAAGAQATS